MEPTSSVFTALSDALLASPLVAVCAGLMVAVVGLWKRQADLEKEFRLYSQQQGAQTAALLDRATKAIERIEERLIAGRRE